MATMSDAKKNYDPKQSASELFNYLKDRALSVAVSATKSAPSADRVHAAILSVLAGGPKNAAQLAESISAASAATWSPTSAEIHGALAQLEEREFVSSKNKGDRKVYAITKAGEDELKTLLRNNNESGSKANETASKKLDPMSWLNCEPNFLVTATKLGPVFLDIAETGNKTQQARAVEVLEKARLELHQILAEK
jgi:DNA-binding PadR family transcriptional regulator